MNFLHAHGSGKWPFLALNSLWTSRVAGLLFVAVALAASGCGRSTLVIPPDKGAGPQTVIAKALTLQEQADVAWQTKNMLEAERLYGILARNPATPLADRPLAFERQAVAAVASKHGRSALEALDRWRAADPAAVNLPGWNHTWAEALLQLPASEAGRRAKTLWDSASLSPVLKGQAGNVMLISAPVEDKPALSDALQRLYASTDPGSRQVLEQGLLAVLSRTTGQQLTELLNLAGGERDHAFPWSVTLLEQVRRAKAVQSSQAEAFLARISGPAVFSDPNLLTQALQSGMPAMESSMVSVASRVPMNAGCYAMALPMSGPFAAIGTKVAAGGKAAQEELAHSGIATELTILNTESPDWLTRLAQLPPQCVTVGGPLLPAAFSAAKSQGLNRSRAFFTFLSRLDGQDEGTQAWRFFSSPEDQVQAVTKFARGLGLTRYASLYPSEEYGKRMTDLLSREVGAGLEKVASYSPDEPKQWNSTIQSFVGSYVVNKAPVPSSSFEAVFLPDSWEKSEVIIPYLFFHGEDRLLLMGTALWEQTLARQNKIDAHNLGLAIFPGAWNSATPSSAALTLINNRSAAGQETPDAWTGIGYDFVRFAAALNLKEGWTSAIVNTRLAEAQNMEWSVAPIRWNQGRAQQHLFVFTPLANGFEVADPETFKARLDDVRARHARRTDSARRGTKS